MQLITTFLIFSLMLTEVIAQSADSVISRYIQALGSREKLEMVKDRTTYLSGVVEGTKVTITIYQKSPDLFRQDISSKNINQVLYYNGSKGVLVSAAGETELKGQTLKDLQLDAYLNPILDLKQAGISVSYSGIEDIEGKETYKLIMQTDSSKIWSEYYDVETGLKLRQVKTINSSTGSFNQVTDFEDYREVEGIKYPYKLIQSIGKQQIIMDVKLIKVNTGIDDEFFNPENN